MAAAVENGARGVANHGSQNVEITSVTWNDGDTFVTEWANIAYAHFIPTTNASYGLTTSGTTVTFHSGGSLTGMLIVYS